MITKKTLSALSSLLLINKFELYDFELNVVGGIISMEPTSISWYVIQMK